MGPSVTQLLIILVIIALLFGTKKLRNIGSDLGGAIRGFRKAAKEGEESETASKEKLEEQNQNRVIEGEATREKDKT